LALFRRHEPLHRRLAREGGLDPPPVDPGPYWGEVGIHGVPRPREWDAVVTADAPELAGDELRFVVLEDGTLLVEEGADDDDPNPLADALEGAVPPPFRVEARRRAGSTWAAGARRIDVVELDEQIAGDELSLTIHEGARDLRVNGEATFGSVRALERWAGERFESYSLTATRLDGDLWEVKVAPL
jgi:hypothetical protein